MESVPAEGRKRHSFPVGERDLQLEVLARERDLADELLHTRQTEPLGETLQRRLAMAELICRDLALRSEYALESPTYTDDQARKGQNGEPDYGGPQTPRLVKAGGQEIDRSQIETHPGPAGQVEEKQALRLHLLQAQPLHLRRR